MDDNVYAITASIILSFITASIVIFYFYKWLRPKFSITVNCWFCHCDSVVKYNQKNSWNCPSCRQYNGFDLNGDYNCVIPEQYDIPFDTSVKYCETVSCKENPNGLCGTCNRNQVLKVKQLSQFEPINEEYFNEEVEEYQRYLESIYPLCSTCDVSVKQKLTHLNREHRKDVLNWRLNKKNELLRLQRQKSTNGLLKAILVYALRLCSLIIGIASLIPSINQSVDDGDRLNSIANVWTTVLILFIDGNRLFLPVIGFFAAAMAVFTAGINKLQILDAIVCFLWLLVVFIYIPILVIVLSSYNIYEEVRIVLTCLAVLTSAYTMFHNQWMRKRNCFTRYNKQNQSTVKSSIVLPKNSEDIDKLSDNEDDDDCKQLQDDRITTTFSSQKDATINSGLSAMTISTPKKSGSLSNVFTKKTYGNLSLPSEFSMPTTVVRASILSPPRFHPSKSNYSPWGSTGNLQFSRPFIYGKFSSGYYQPVGISFSCPASRAGSVSGDDRFSIFSEPITMPAPWNSILKPNVLSCRQKSASPSESVSSNSNHSLNMNSIKDFEKRKCVSTVKSSTTQNNSKSFIMKNRQILTQLVLFVSLIGNAFLLLSISYSKFPKWWVF